MVGKRFGWHRMRRSRWMKTARPRWSVSPKVVSWHLVSWCIDVFVLLSADKHVFFLHQANHCQYWTGIAMRSLYAVRFFTALPNQIKHCKVSYIWQQFEPSIIIFPTSAFRAMITKHFSAHKSDFVSTVSRFHGMKWALFSILISIQFQQNQAEWRLCPRIWMKVRLWLEVTLPLSVGRTAQDLRQITPGLFFPQDAFSTLSSECNFTPLYTLNGVFRNSFPLLRQAWKVNNNSIACLFETHVF